MNDEITYTIFENQESINERIKWEYENPAQSFYDFDDEIINYKDIRGV